MLPKKIDKSKTYYKVTNKKECHHNLQYKTGLNIDPVPFNKDPDKSGCRGGIYFTTPEYIHKFFWMGYRIREVTIPEDARVVLDPIKDKYRADKIILGKRYNFEWYFNNFFDKKTFPKKDYLFLVEHCSEHFNKWFDKRFFPKESYWCLTKHCSEYFDEWFDRKTFPKKDYWYLAANYSELYDKWFDKETFPKESYWSLIEFCPSYNHIIGNNYDKVQS